MEISLLIAHKWGLMDSHFKEVSCRICPQSDSHIGNTTCNNPRNLCIAKKTSKSTVIKMEKVIKIYEDSN